MSVVLTNGKTYRVRRADGSIETVNVARLLPVTGSFLQLRVLYLGSYISLNKIEPDHAKVQGIMSASSPSDKNQLRSFLGAASYLRNFVPQFSEIAQPLTDLTRKGRPFEWGDIEQSAFETLKTSLISITYLTIPNPSVPFRYGRQRFGNRRSSSIRGRERYI